MNEFKRQSCMGVREGYWMDFKTNRNSKWEARRQARHNLKKEDRKNREVDAV